MDTLRKMKPNAGDIVGCVEDGAGLFTEGKNYEVFKRSGETSEYVVRDDGYEIYCDQVTLSLFTLVYQDPLPADGDSEPMDDLTFIRDLFEEETFPFDAPADDVIHKPLHYARWKIEPITFIMRNGFEFWRGNIVKYASRAGHKMYPEMDENQSEITDLQKVIRYAEMRINQLNGEVEL